MCLDWHNRDQPQVQVPNLVQDTAQPSLVGGADQGSYGRVLALDHDCQAIEPIRPAIIKFPLHFDLENHSLVNGVFLSHRHEYSRWHRTILLRLLRPTV